MNWERLLCIEREGPTTSTDTPTRNAFDGDYDRTVFSTPVRRLQDKAQVFPLDPNDAVRTRLTHSLEVSTVARSLTRQAMAAVRDDARFADNLKPKPEQLRSIETIAATCGLIHDLGNPPFGHAGEDAIREWFRTNGERLELGQLDSDQQRQDFLNFEGNAQTLRLLSRLQVLADCNGLNLTYGTLSASCKYTASSKEAGQEGGWHERSKPGFFTSEAELVDRIRDRTGTGPARNPIAFLVEAADDIVYAAGDLEDAVKKRVLSWEELRNRLLEQADEMDGADSDLIVRVVGRANKQIEDQLNRSKPKPQIQDDARAAAFRIQSQAFAIRSVLQTFVDNYEPIMAGEYHDALESGGEAASILRVCKQVGRRFVYGADPTPKLEVLGRKVIHDLMDVFWEGAEVVDRSGKTKTFSQKIASLISKNYVDTALSSIEEKRLPEKYHRLQLVTDFVCGMTDSFARDRHRELFNG